MFRNPQWARYWPTEIVVRTATIGSIGQFPAPGTWGSLVGLLVYAVLIYPASTGWSFALMALLVYLAVGICGEAEKRLKKVDPSEIVLDEVVAIPLCFIGLKPYLGADYSLFVIMGAFAVFRLFDITKPFGIKHLQRYYGGFGVVIDDVAAGLATAGVMNLVLRLVVPALSQL